MASLKDFWNPNPDIQKALTNYPDKDFLNELIQEVFFNEFLHKNPNINYKVRYINIWFLDIQLKKLKDFCIENNSQADLSPLNKIFPVLITLVCQYANKFGKKCLRKQKGK